MTGFSKSNISRYESEKMSPASDFVASLAEKVNISLDWLT
ncbi:helix-turn-helix domain-containing protein [Brevibacillus fortis]